MSSNILLIDNYDSFTYNLAQYVWELGYKCEVKRNDQISIADIQSFNPSHIIISPGPGTPNDAGISLQVLEAFHQSKSILGVCLGHQCIGQFFGSTIIRTDNPMHGKTSLVKHNNEGVFSDIQSPFQATRYHSLVIDETTINKQLLQITARSENDDLVMGVQHASLPIFGVQFHPESVMSEHGHRMLQNFVEYQTD
jgi:anthranilate synthase/aminodeoxychorismate synthase-like glutamine amidotransferase